jgi:hypothetical protein
LKPHFVASEVSWTLIVFGCSMFVACMGLNFLGKPVEPSLPTGAVGIIAMGAGLRRDAKNADRKDSNGAD